MAPAFFSAGLLDQDTAYGRGRGRKEMLAILKALVFPAHQSEPGLMHQRRGLEGVTRPFVGHLVRRQLPEFVIDERE